MLQKTMGVRVRLVKLLPSWLRYAAPGCMLLALCCNILGVILPFIEVDTFLAAKKIYSLPHSVDLMWRHHLYFLCVLVLIFSIIFPFVKLASLCASMYFPLANNIRTKVLKICEAWGKFSYLDIFIVILLVVLTHQQMFVVAKVHAGIYFFITAITLNMLLSQVLWRRNAWVMRASLALELKQQDTEVHRPHSWSPKNICSVVILMLAIVVWIMAIGLDFLQIKQNFLAPKMYSIYSSVGALYYDQHRVLCFVLALSLIILPAARFILLLCSFFLPQSTPRMCYCKQLCSTLARNLRQWCMLDVFVLGLLLTISEGGYLIKTHTMPGLYFILIALVLVELLLYTLRVSRADMEFAD